MKTEEYEVDTYTLVLDDISEDTTPKDLRMLFSKYGRVFLVRIDSDYEAEFCEDLAPESKKVTASVTMPDCDAARARRKLHGPSLAGTNTKHRRSYLTSGPTLASKQQMRRSVTNGRAAADRQTGGSLVRAGC
jgi:hypothetical protein